MNQVVIALTGATAIWLSQDERAEWRKGACIFGGIRYHWMRTKSVLGKN
jgi:hypothetical protein